MKRVLSILFLLLAAVCASAQTLERVAPEQAGMNSRHLQYADQAVGRAVARGNIPGAVLAVVRHGKVAYLKRYAVQADSMPSVAACLDMCSRVHDSAGGLVQGGEIFSLAACGYDDFSGTLTTAGKDGDAEVILLINSAHPRAKGRVLRLRTELATIVEAAVNPAQRLYTDYYYKRFLEFEDAAPITPDNIVMLGDSLTEGGRDWESKLGRQGIVNRGIVGDEALGIYDRLHQILPGHPAQIFLLVGVNDISHDLSSEEIVRRIRTVVERIRAESPRTSLCIQSLLPIDESVGRYKRLIGKSAMIPEINTMLQAMAKETGAEYIDLFPLFTEGDSQVLRRSLTSDGLHINREGYEIWSNAIKKYLKTR